MGKRNLYASHLCAESNFCVEGWKSLESVFQAISYPLIPSPENLLKASKVLQNYSYREPLNTWATIDWFFQERHFLWRGKASNFVLW